MGVLELKVEKAPPDGPGRLPVQEGSANVESLPESRRVLMAAGGTGGHIFPALAVAEELRARSVRRLLLIRPGLEVAEEQGVRAERRKLLETLPQGGLRIRSTVQFLGTKRGMESRLIPAAGFSLRTVRAAGLKGVGGWRKLLNLLVLPQSALETALVLREFQPDVVVGLGGYLAGPAMLEAALANIPTLLIEPNAVPGFTNRVLGPMVRLAAVGFEQAAEFYGAKARVTGHPVRKAFYEIPPKKHVPPFTVLIMGGSQGSKAINECVVKSLVLIRPDTERLRIIHQTGDRDYNGVEDAYREQGVSAEIRAFIESTPHAFAQADLVISRAGAMTVAELAAAGKAALFIPFPGATDHHQLENARAMERAGAARVIVQAELKPERLVEEVWDLLNHPERLAQMEQRARTLARPDAAERIADLIEGLAVRRH